MDVDADVRFQHWVWTAQRIGWIIIGLLVAAALAGLFGHRTSESRVGTRFQSADRLRALWMAAATHEAKVLSLRDKIRHASRPEPLVLRASSSQRDHTPSCTGRICRARGGLLLRRPGTDVRGRSI